MSFSSTQADQIVTAVPATPYSIKEIADSVEYIYTDDGTTQTLYTAGVPSVSTPLTGNLIMNETSQLSGLTVVERTLYEVYDGILITNN